MKYKNQSSLKIEGIIKKKKNVPTIIKYLNLNSIFDQFIIQVLAVLL